MTRKVLFVVHAGRPSAVEVAQIAAQGLDAAGIQVLCASADFVDLNIPQLVSSDDATGCELVIVFGGDGTILRGIEFAKPAGVPVLGVNLGHVGFLAESEPEKIADVIDAVINHTWSVENRMAITVDVSLNDSPVWSSWALNEVAIEKHNRERMADLLVQVDGHALSRWSCDGILCSTPTGSTAYAFSAGGPVVWPEVDALLVVPVSAHALFSRPLVIAPSSVIDLQVLGGDVVVSADGRRTFDAVEGATVTVRRDDQAIKFARIHPAPFTDRLVAKFELPVQGWRLSR